MQNPNMSAHSPSTNDVEGALVFVAKNLEGTSIGPPISGSLLGGEYLGWTGFPGFSAQADAMSIGHLRWPGGINAEDRIEDAGYAYDLATSNVVDNWPTWNGAPRPGLTEMFSFANAEQISLAIILPTARYVELAQTDLDAAKAWMQSDINTFLANLANGQFGASPPLTLEVGAEYYSTDIWEETGGDPVIRDLFGEVFAEAVRLLAEGEDTYGEMYDVAVQMGRFHNADDPSDGPRNGEAADSTAFLDAYSDAGVLSDIDATIWHRYTQTFDQTGHAFRSPIHPDNAMSTLLDDHLAYWEAAAGKPLDLVVSWAAPDVDSSGGTDTTDYDFGPRSAHNILQMFSEIARSPADIATVYGIDSQWPGALSYGSPESPDIYYGGMVYGLLAESVIGLSVTDTYLSNTMPVDENNDVIVQNHVNYFDFIADNKYVLFAVASDLQTNQLTVTLDLPFAEDFDHVQVTRLTPDGDGTFATGTRTTEAPLDFSTDGIEFEFRDDFEVLRFEFQNGIAPHPGDDLVTTYHGRNGTVTQVIGTTDEADGAFYQGLPYAELNSTDRPHEDHLTIMCGAGTDDFIF